MSKGKVKSGDSVYKSKGIIGTNKKIKNKIRNSRDVLTIEIAKFQAFLKGKNVWFTIDNPNKLETNKKKIRVNAKDLLGNCKERQKYSFQMK